MTNAGPLETPVVVKYDTPQEKEFLGLLLDDLSLSGWTGNFKNNHLELSKKTEESIESKDKIREVHKQYRNIQLCDPAVRRFIKSLNAVKYVKGREVS